MPEQTYWDWQPLNCSDEESYAFFHGWKTKHIEILNPQPDLISRGVPYCKQGKTYLQIVPRWPKGPTHYFLQEPFRITRPIKVNDLGHRQTVTFHMDYKNDNHQRWRTIDSESIDHLPDLLVNHWYPASAMPRYLARKKFTVKSVKLSQIEDITEQDARDHGVKRYAGGYFYQDYHKKNDPNAEYLTSALESFRSLFQVLAVTMKLDPASNLYVFSTSFRSLDCTGKVGRVL